MVPTSLSECLTLLACALALRCAHRAAATMAGIADSLDAIKQILAERNEYARRALEQLDAHQLSMPIIQTPRRRSRPPPASVSAADTL